MLGLQDKALYAVGPAILMMAALGHDLHADVPTKMLSKPSLATTSSQQGQTLVSFPVADEMPTSRKYAAMVVYVDRIDHPSQSVAVSPLSGDPETLLQHANRTLEHLGATVISLGKQRADICTTSAGEERDLDKVALSRSGEISQAAYDRFHDEIDDTILGEFIDRENPNFGAPTAKQRSSLPIYRPQTASGELNVDYYDIQAVEERSRNAETQLMLVKVTGQTAAEPMSTMPNFPRLVHSLDVLDATLTRDDEDLRFRIVELKKLAPGGHPVTPSANTPVSKPGS